MKKKHWLIKVTIGLCVLVLLMTLFDFLALHDIKNEYVSTRILNYLDITLSEDLPDWTATKGEWEVVHVSFLSRLIFFVLNILVLTLCLKTIKKEKD